MIVAISLKLADLCLEKCTLQSMKSYMFTLNWKRQVNEASFTILNLKMWKFFFSFAFSDLLRIRKRFFPHWLSQQHEDRFLSSRLATLFRSYCRHQQSYLRKIRVGTTSTVCQRNRLKRHMPLLLNPPLV